MTNVKRRFGRLHCANEQHASEQGTDSCRETAKTALEKGALAVKHLTNVGLPGFILRESYQGYGAPMHRPRMLMHFVSWQEWHVILLTNTAKQAQAAHP